MAYFVFAPRKKKISERYRLIQLESAVPCPTCGRMATEFHEHHILPRAKGGTDIPTNMVNLCTDCHGKIHSHSFTTHKELVKAGLAAARQAGRIGGRPRGKNKQLFSKIVELVGVGVKPTEIAARLDVSRATVYAYIKEWGELDSNQRPSACHTDALTN